MTAKSYRSFLSILTALTTMVLLVAGCGGGGTTGGTTDPTDPGDTDPSADAETSEPGYALIGVDPAKFGDAGLEAQIQAFGTIVTEDAKGATYRVQLADGQTVASVNTALTTRDVLYVEPNYHAHPMAAGADAFFGQVNSYGQYGKTVEDEMVAAWAAWANGGKPADTDSVTIAVLDSGVSASHEDLTNKVLPGHNVVPGAADATDASDLDGHGTQVAGVAAAEIGDSVGIAGVAVAADATSGEDLANDAGAYILPVKVADATHIATHASIANGIYWVLNNGTPRAKIILCSLGSGAPSWTLQKAIEAARTAGVLVVAAAGNNGTSAMKYPAAYQATKQQVIAVTSVDGTDTLSSGANYGSWVALAAPGDNIVTTSIGGSDDFYTDGSDNAHAKVSGTSFSAAWVAGAAAVAWTKYPALTLDQLVTVLTKSVDTINVGSTKIKTNGGRLNVEALMRNAKNAAGADAVIPTAIVFSANTVVSGGSLTGTVVLSKAAATGGQAVTLASTGTDATDATVPASITIPANASTGTFKLTAGSVAVAKHPIITATANAVTASQAITVQLPGISSIKLDKSSVTGGSPYTATVTFNAALANDATIHVTSNNAAIPTVSPDPVLTAGKTSIKFSVPTAAVAADVASVVVTATSNGVSKSASAVKVLAPKVSSVSFAPSTTVVWQSPGTSGSVTGTVTLSGPAPAGGSAVTLTASDFGIYVPATVTVQADHNQGTFTVQPEPVTVATSYSVSAVLGTVSLANPLKTGTFKVNPALSGFAISPSNVATATTSTGTVTLGSVAPVGGAAVDVAIDPTLCGGAGAPAAAQAAVYFAGPACSTTVTVAAGSKTAPVTLNVRGTANAIVPVTASFLGVNKVAKITAAMPTIRSLTLASSPIGAGNDVQGTITLSGNAIANMTVQLAVASSPNQGTVALRASAGGASADTLSVTVNAGSSTGTFYVHGTAAGSDSVKATVLGSPAAAKVLAVTVRAAADVTVNLAGITTRVGGLQNITGAKVTLGSAAGADTVFDLTLRNAPAGVALSVASVTVSSGQTDSALFNVTTSYTSSTTNGIVVRATNHTTGEYVDSAAFAVTPTLSSITLGNAIVGSGSITGHVTLAAAAPGAVAITLASTDATIITVDGSVSVSQGQTDSADFTVTGAGLGTAKITASVGSASIQSGNVTVSGQPLAAGALNVTTLDLTDPTSVDNTSVQLTLTGNAVTGESCTAASSDATVVTVTSPIAVTAGQTHANLDIHAAGPGWANVTVTCYGVTSSAVFVNVPDATQPTALLVLTDNAGGTLASGANAGALTGDATPNPAWNKIVLHTVGAGCSALTFTSNAGNQAGSAFSVVAGEPTYTVGGGEASADFDIANDGSAPGTTCTVYGKVLNLAGTVLGDATPVTYSVQ